MPVEGMQKIEGHVRPKEREGACHGKKEDGGRNLNKERDLITGKTKTRGT